MNILVIESSPHKKGSSNLLAGHFIEGAEEAGHQEQILQADMLVFVTPLYYFGMSTQLKTVIDRFYSFNGALTGKRVKTALIVAAWDSKEWTMKDIQSHYETLCGYLDFQDQGQILGTGCGTVSMTRATEFPKQAYELGKSL